MEEIKKTSEKDWGFIEIIERVDGSYITSLYSPIGRHILCIAEGDTVIKALQNLVNALDVVMDSMKDTKENKY